MKESYFFRPIKGVIKEKKRATQVRKLTPSEQEGITQPMTLRDYWLSLRRSIQEKIYPEQPIQEKIEKIRPINELITPSLISEYKKILKHFRAKTQKTKEHPQRDFIDIDSGELAEDIEAWIENLINEIKNKRDNSFGEIDIEELRAQCWLFFGAVANVMNANSLEKDIREFYRNRKLDNKEEGKKQKIELIKQLQSRYPLDKTDIEILVDLIEFETKNKDYSLRTFVETINRLWIEYGLNKKSKKIAKISFGYLMAKTVESFAPSLFQNIIVQDRFNTVVFLEYFGLNKLAAMINSQTEIELAKVINDVNHQINERIINSLFFREFEFTHERSFGEIYTALERGKVAIAQILQDTISKFTPTLTGIVMSLMFLTKINPILGSIGIGSLPIMYTIAKRQSELLWLIYEKEKKEGEKISTRLGSIKSGFEEIKTSPETPQIASSVREQMNVRDMFSLCRFIEEVKNRLKNMIPFDISTIVSAVVGGTLQELGMISGGAVLSNIIYSNQLNRPIQDLVNLYFNRFSRYIQDIQRMYEILGRYDELDLPEGEKEKSRISVSKLPNFDISIKNLKYKNILQNLNLDIKQGEFITITGESGIGKSTFLRILAGIYRVDDGEVEIGGIAIQNIKKYGPQSLYSVISYCNQSPQIFEEMTLRENLLLWSRGGVDDEKIKRVLLDLRLDKFVDRLDDTVKHLSNGEKVRIGLARMLIKDAKIILLDEPTASLDSQTATEIRKIISEIHERYPDKTIICVSHDEGLVRISKRSVSITDLQK